jgi:cytochrome P450
LGGLIGPGRNPLTFLAQLARDYGDIVSFRLGTDRAVFVNDPRVIRDVLVTNYTNFTKSRGLQRAKKLLGEGLLTSEQPAHLRARRLLQPAFHRDRVAGYGEVMIEYADRAQRRWVSGRAMDVSKEMARLTLDIVGKTLFDADVDSQAESVGRALTEVMESYWVALLPLPDLVDALPLPTLRRSRAARARLDAIIYDLIAQRRAGGGDRGDVLSMLLMARDEGGDATGFDDVQVRDEVMTLFLAGHETTANALSWTWYLLSQDAEVEVRLHEELRHVLGSRLPSVTDVHALPFTESVIAEAMRLYPPAWLIGRRAIAAFEAGGFVVPAGALVFTSPYVLQRDPRYFPEPDRFHPDRWTPSFKASLPKFAYFPFGGGPRQCIGESFARMELLLVVATLAQRWRFRMKSARPVVPQPLVTLRPKHGMVMIPESRGEP